MSTYAQSTEDAIVDVENTESRKIQSDGPQTYNTFVDSTEPLYGSSQTSLKSASDGVAELSNFRISLIVFQLSGINFFASMSTGLIVIGLPRIAADVNLSAKLYLWPASVYNLATGATLLLAGAVADIIGARSVDLAGCFGIALLLLGIGFVQTGEQLVALRALQGLATSMHLPTSVAICSKILPSGQGRNVAFSCLGLSQPLGFSLGLVVGGIFADTIGWRFGWYLCGAITLLLSIIAVWSLPKSYIKHDKSILRVLASKIDWVGACMASTSITMISYVLALVSVDIAELRHAQAIICLCIGIALIPGFTYWMRIRVKANKSALIPNSMWKNKAFSSICLTVLLCFAVIQSMELFSSLFFQEVQHLSALQASLRILPSLIVGTILNFITGMFVNKIPAFWLVTISSLLCAGSPLLMATIPINQPYWYNAFVAQLLQPISADVLYTVGLIVISEVFTDETQALAGAIFNTVAQFGMALGLALMQVVSMLVSHHASDGHGGDSDVMMVGYRASFWTMFAFMIACVVTGGFGLRKIGMVGLGKASES